MTRRDSKFVSVYNAAVDTIKFHQRHPLPNAPVKGHVALSRHTPLRRASQSHVWQPSHLRGVPDTISSHHREAPKRHNSSGCRDIACRRKAGAQPAPSTYTLPSTSHLACRCRSLRESNGGGTPGRPCQTDSVEPATEAKGMPA